MDIVYLLPVLILRLRGEKVIKENLRENSRSEIIYQAHALPIQNLKTIFSLSFNFRYRFPFLSQYDSGGARPFTYLPTISIFRYHLDDRVSK